MKKRIIFSILILAVLVFAACESSPSSSSSSRPARWVGVVYTGEEDRQLEGTTWDTNVTYENGSHALVEFRRGGRVVSTLFSGNASWQRIGDTIKIVFTNGENYFEGVYYSDTQRILGQLYDSYRNTGMDLTFTPVSSSIIGASTPQAPVQPSTPTPAAAAPTQTAPQQSAPATPTLRGGVYAYVNTNIVMDLNATLYQVTAYVGNKTIARGSFSIRGDQLVITFRTGTDEGAALQGNTYAYTITSNTSFSGSGEDWVYRGGIIVPSTR